MVANVKKPQKILLPWVPLITIWDFFKGGGGAVFEGDPYVTYRVPKCVSDD